MDRQFWRWTSKRLSHRLAIALVAIAAVAAMASCSDPAQAEIDRGDDLYNANKLDEAFAAYDAAVELDPDNAYARL